MTNLTARIIGADGNMGREHVAAYTEAGVEIVEGNPHIVSIASPDSTHEEYVIEALNEGRHVFCEKPLATTMAGLDTIKYMADDRHIGQNFPLRHIGKFKLAKVGLNGYGEIYRVDACYNWGRTHKLNEGWRKDDPKYSLVMGGLIHMIDLVIWLTGLNLQVVSVVGTNKSAPHIKADTVTALCRLSNGGICTLTVDGGSGVKEHAHTLTLCGTKHSWSGVNTVTASKRACIHEFIKNIRDGGPPQNDFRATEIALEIDRWA